ncbi:hypothetical protein HELRODRAFT_178811 [Helobdella robusta]|uniref:Xrn1 helical domain-containing protein n=1 Tax=Helobdella robusta TaxID=6412 RepID=T1FDS0_HELRO|nr:hypothetical protein HELRODRAFT_178811 [Helobdella robusta]ESN95896.1 hypothetical protein HELRODRAFT_178811 [Helobdella robusta]
MYQNSPVMKKGNYYDTNNPTGAVKVFWSLHAEEMDEKSNNYWKDCREKRSRSTRKYIREVLVSLVEYHYKGCPCSDWYYPYIQAPPASDFKNYKWPDSPMTFLGSEKLEMKEPTGRLFAHKEVFNSGKILTSNSIAGTIGRNDTQRFDCSQALVVRFENPQINKRFVFPFGLRLGLPILTEYVFLCGANVEPLGYHGLSCRLGPGRRARHSAMNDFLVRYINLTSQEAGAAALRAADFKNSKYAAPAESKIFQPVCIETFGPPMLRLRVF